MLTKGSPCPRILGFGCGLYVKWRNICKDCIGGVDSIIANPEIAPVVIMKARQNKEKEWKNYKSKNPKASRVKCAACCDSCCRSCWGGCRGFFLGCVDQRYFCARWLLSNFIPPPEEDDAAGGAVGLDDVSVSGFGGDSDEEGGSFAVLIKGRQLQLVPPWATEPGRLCCMAVEPAQQPPEPQHFWMTERPLEIRWASRRGTYFTRAAVTACREDAGRWADEIAARREQVERIQNKPFGPKMPDEEALAAMPAWKRLQIESQQPSQADVNEEQRLRRQQLDILRDKIDALEQCQARSFTVSTAQKGDLQIMAPTEGVREMWVETMNDMIAEVSVGERSEQWKVVEG